MMGATHLFVGTMAALLVTEPGSPEECLTALVGGIAGGLICDIDQKVGRRIPKLSRIAGIAGVLLVAGAAIQWVSRVGFLHCLCGSAHPSFIPGLFSLALLCVWGMMQPHRGGTHSLLSVALFGGCIHLMCDAMSMPFVISAMSHLVLDMLNRQPIRILYPLRFGWCLNICRADGRLNRWLRDIGILGTVFALGICIGRIY